MALQTDDELVRLARSGCAWAFDRIVERYHRPLFNFLLRMLKNREDAEDVLQEVFIRAAGGIKKYRPESRFKSWLFTIANNLAVSRLRKNKRRKILGFVRTGEQESEAENPVYSIPDETYEPGRAAERAELEAVIEKAVESLPPEQKQVFLLREYSGLSFREIAEILNIPLNTALGRMHYAYSKLREAFKEIYPRGFG